MPSPGNYARAMAARTWAESSTAFEGAVRDELVVSVFPGPLARLSSVKVALVRHFSCSEFELRARVAIALN